jgi:hypothetical protein
MLLFVCMGHFTVIQDDGHRWPNLVKLWYNTKGRGLLFLRIVLQLFEDRGTEIARFVLYY